MTFIEFYNNEGVDHWNDKDPNVHAIKEWVKKKKDGESTTIEEDRSILDKALDYGNDDLIKIVAKYNPRVTMEQIKRMSSSKDHVIYDILDYLVRKYYKRTGDESIHQKIAKHVANYPFADLNPRWEAANFNQQLYKQGHNPEDDAIEEEIEEEFELVLSDD